MKLINVGPFRRTMPLILKSVTKHLIFGTYHTALHLWHMTQNPCTQPDFLQDTSVYKYSHNDSGPFRTGTFQHRKDGNPKHAQQKEDRETRGWGCHPLADTARDMSLWRFGHPIALFTSPGSENGSVDNFLSGLVANRWKPTNGAKKNMFAM